MTYRLRLTGRAVEDLDRLPDFVDLANPAAAARIRPVLEAAIASLAELPHRGRPIGKGVRELPVEFGRYGYKIRYRVAGEDVVVLRLKHAREDR